MNTCVELSAEEVRDAIHKHMNRLGNRSADPGTIRLYEDGSATATITSTAKYHQNRTPFSIKEAITYQGQTKHLKDWAIEKGLNFSTVLNRLRLGWSMEKALETPPLFRKGVNR